MNSIEFGKKCRPYNLQYRELFGYVPCRADYHGNQEEYFNALVKAITEKRELSELLKKRNINYLDTDKKY